MQTIQAPLNLARKWRSKTFDTIVGQSLAVRMLKNSLYLNYYFPVYLFAGQRGCGKTTTARIFAAALNCHELSEFQKNPKSVQMPCLQCDSCIAMAANNHPDFIEIDAASHTGVDNVRVIIDAASLLPVLGNKKIYLIDEAHMLSKAAFNAFLKILEEPPQSVHFMLATTDPHKIIETVRSRCFQLFFTAIDNEVLFNHLRTICTQENINADEPGLRLIVRQSQGSARDAINLLEQVRFAAETVNKQSVASILGIMADEQLLQLFTLVLSADVQALINWLEEHKLERYRAGMLWDNFLELTRAAIWHKNGQQLPGYEQCAEFFEQKKSLFTVAMLASWLEQFYSYEMLFLKTVGQHRLFESILIELCQKRNNPIVQPRAIQKEAVKAIEHAVQDSDTRWLALVNDIALLNDPLLYSIFKQGRFVQLNEQNNSIEIAFTKDFAFYDERLQNSKQQWQPLIVKHFRKNLELAALFIDESKRTEQTPIVSRTITSQAQTVSEKPNEPVIEKKKTMIMPRSVKARIIDVSDASKWPTANLMLSYFPGTIMEIQEFEQ
jgi:DNA polymerase-3 subunit gamma/tau